MKAGIQLSCEFEEIPEEVADLIFNVWNRSHGKLGDLLSMAKKSCGKNQPLEALGEIDNIRKELKKMDDRLLECASILTGYVKAQADLKSGQEINTIPPEAIEGINVETQND
jgi:hypothetical protein